MKIFRLLGAIWLCLWGASLVNAQGYHPPTFEIVATLNPSTQTLEARQKIIFKSPFSEPTSTIYLNVYSGPRQKNPYYTPFSANINYQAGFEPGGMYVKNVTSPSEVPFEWEYINDTSFVRFSKYSNKNSVKVNLLEPLNPSESVTMYVEFQVKIPRRVQGADNTIFKDMIAVSGAWYPNIAPIVDRNWASNRFILMPHTLKNLVLNDWFKFRDRVAKY